MLPNLVYDGKGTGCNQAWQQCCLATELGSSEHSICLCLQRILFVRVGAVIHQL